MADGNEVKVLFQDESLIAVHKPAGVLVHRSKLATDRITLMQMVRDQIHQHVFPIHRLDRGTSGIVLFALDAETASELGKAAMEQRIGKQYLAILRGWIPENGLIDSPLANETTGKLQEARTEFVRLSTAELPIPVDRYATARYSLAEITLQTGRLHQIRKHFNHLRHPLLGDHKHGDRHHNRMWKEVLGMEGMMLMAWKMQFKHPKSGEQIHLKTSPDTHFSRAMEKLGFGLPTEMQP